MKLRGILIAIGILISVTVTSGCAKQEERQPTRDYYSEIKSVNKLILAQMTISKMAIIDDVKLSEAQGIKQITAGLVDAMKVGKRKGAYSYNTYMRAYIDMNSFYPEDVEVSEEDKTITVTLPAVQTEFTGRDPEITEEHYRVSGLRTSISPEERANVKELMNSTLIEEVENKPYFRDRLALEGRQRAKSYFKSLLEEDGYTVTIRFRS